MHKKQAGRQAAPGDGALLPQAVAATCCVKLSQDVAPQCSPVLGRSRGRG